MKSLPVTAVDFFLDKKSGSRVREEREMNLWSPSAPPRTEGGTAMVQVRESSRFGFCYALGELIGETATRYIYRNRAGIAYVSKGSLIHVAPCTGCVDYREREEVA
jgi:hypothetical protein